MATMQKPRTAATPREARSVRLVDARKLGYAEYGTPDGMPVLYFHGTPGSRMEGRLLHDAAVTSGVRLIAVDRPGHGLSSFQQGRRITRWPADVRRLADALELERFSLLGFSNGCVYALACGAALPDRIDTIALIGASEPRRDDGGARLQVMRWTSSPFAWLMMQLSRLPVKLIPPMDPSLRRGDVKRVFRTASHEAFRKGSRGVAHELTMFTRRWGFSAQDVATPVHVWHAEDDALAPVDGARALERELPHADIAVVSEGGHYLQARCGAPILRALVAARR